jgi:hypothetical protein
MNASAHRLAPFALAGMLAACQAAPPAAANSVPFQVLHTSATCGTEEASVRPIGDAMRLKQVLESGSTMIGSPPAVRADFDGSLVLRVSMGQQPSAGALLAMLSARADGTRRQLVLEMQWAPPDASRMNAAVVTRPCVILSVPRDDYRSVQVVDATGRERTSTPLPEAR